MEKERICISIEEEDDEIEAIVAPYFLVTYVDDWGRTHIAQVKDDVYLAYLKDRFYVKESRLVEA